MAPANQYPRKTLGHHTSQGEGMARRIAPPQRYLLHIKSLPFIVNRQEQIKEEGI